MDGRVDRRGCEMGEERCDICRGAPRGQKRRRMVSYGVSEGSRMQEDVNESWAVSGSGSGSGFEDDVTGSGFEGDMTGSGFGVFDSSLGSTGQSWEIQRAEEARKEREMEEDKKMRAEWEEESRKQEMIRWRRIEEKTRAGFDSEELNKFWEEWVGVCAICKVQGKQAEGHSDWRECTADEEDKRVMQVTVERLTEEVVFERFSGCWFCKMPQGICHLWEEDRQRGGVRFSRRAVGRCQYPGLMMDVAGAVLGFKYGDGVEEWVRGEQEKTGFMKEDSEMVIDDWERLKKWMGRKVMIRHERRDGK